uniref:F-box domain-containing protein n=1 Tax=Oryza rufipogon TaxID=4529 RepID=A0A0E0Q5T0_ORYRU
MDGGDRLSALPNDVLHLILLRLRSAEAAARTSVLARRWRHVWATLPELRFRMDVSLAAHAAPALRRLEVSTDADDPAASTAALRLAAPRVAGELSFCIWPRWDDAPEEDDGPAPVRRPGVVKLPCFEKATELWLILGLLGVSLPKSGVFAQLTALAFRDVRFTGRCDLGAVVSSKRCPVLQKLQVHDSQDLYNLTIFSESLLHIELSDLHGGMGRLMIVAPLLRVLDVRHCFYWRTYRSHSLVRDQPYAAVFTPALEDLIWVDAYDPTMVQFGGVERLRKLMGRSQYLMEAITMLPAIEVMSLELSKRGHAFGQCVFHLLRMSTGIRKLKLALRGGLKDSEERISVLSTWFQGHQADARCSASCICNRPQAWKTEDLFLDSLQEVEISGFRGSEHELAFLKRRFGWAAILKTFTMHLHLDLTVSDDLCKELLSLATPETDVKIYFYRDDDVHARPAWVLYTPEE